MLTRARARGVGGFITINTRVRKFDAIRQIAAEHPDVFCTVGTHPHNAAEEADVALETILEKADDPLVVGIGEAGLDYHYDYAPRDVQADVFRKHIDAARRTGSEPPPRHILNAPTRLMREQGFGAGYAYDHDAEDGFSGQNYFPETMRRPVFYQPVERGYERELKKRVEWFAKLRDKRNT